MLRRTLPLIIVALLALPMCRPVAPGPGKSAPAPVLAPTANDYVIQSKESQLLVLVYRDGTLARLGHNHVISTTALSGRVRWDGDPAKAAVSVTFPVERLEVDRSELRAAAGADFDSRPDEQAIAGTRGNMLGTSLLDASHYPDITLSSRKIAGALPDLTQTLDIRVRDHTSTRVVPVHAELAGGVLTVTGQLALRQSDLGLTPFSVMLGALSVKDEMNVHFRIVARRAD